MAIETKQPDIDIDRDRVESIDATYRSKEIPLAEMPPEQAKKQAQYLLRAGYIPIGGFRANYTNGSLRPENTRSKPRALKTLGELTCYDVLKNIEVRSTTDASEDETLEDRGIRKEIVAGPYIINGNMGAGSSKLDSHQPRINPEEVKVATNGVMLYRLARKQSADASC